MHPKNQLKKRVKETNYIFEILQNLFKKTNFIFQNAANYPKHKGDQRAEHRNSRITSH